MTLSYAGIGLPLSTPQLEDWLEAVAPRDFYEWANYWNFEGNDLAYLPTPVLPEPPPFKIGKLYWPTGATRPAWFHFVVDDVRLAQIRAAVGDPRTAKNLVMSDGRTGKTVTASMYMLPPIPLTQFGTPGAPFDSPPTGVARDGWLVTLTDQRFYWYWRRGAVGAPVSWTDLFTALGVILGVGITVDAVNSAYLTPSVKWKSYYQPANTVLDAAADQVGQVVVVALDGTVRTVNWETAKAASDAYLLSPTVDPVVSGGLLDLADVGAYVPASVDVVFGGSPTYTPPPQAPYVVNKTLASLAVTEYGAATGVAGTKGQVYADATKTTDPDNAAALAAYATAAAEDWYGWRLPDADLVFPGVEPWAVTGWEDVVEWTYQAREGQPFASTQVRRGVYSEVASGGIPPVTATEYRDKCISGSLWRQKSTDGGYTWTDEINFETPCNERAGSGSGSSGSGSGGASSATLQTIDVLCVGGILYVIRGQAVITLSNGQLSISFTNLVWDAQGCCDCPAGSSGGGALPVCDPTLVAALPSTLFFTISATPGSASSATCAIGVGGTLTKGGDVWTGTFTECGFIFVGFAFSCSGGQWTLGGGSACLVPEGATAAAVLVGGTSSPLNLTFLVPSCWFTGAAYDPADTVTVVISQ